MTILRDVFAELFGMFVGDARLTVAVLAVVGVAAALIDIGDLSPLLGGCVLFVGCLVVLMGAVLRAARHQKAVTASRTA
ncbi:MAG: hypothetical protein CMJ42_07005 [Phyllobacteriaceae bacterium]|uniref:hypothetical protein n=1 Tax=Nitratireductor alexandrii TaxID=2448161 RepID=UPI000C67D4B2|nr:hypothetical protein [Nitratireductor alexandrii]MAW86260.1 hypothetical protein [Phyllobacteriaceae bacterium]MBA91269.1 hypothetical protein [Phyllobacteriaceae bacterium]